MTDDRPSVCNARAYLPSGLVPVALALETRSTPADTEVERGLRCSLQGQHDNDHHGLVLELDGIDTGSVWTRWTTDQLPYVVVVLPDCPGAGGQACSEFAGHPGGHTPEMHDPYSDMSRTLTRPKGTADGHHRR